MKQTTRLHFGLALMAGAVCFAQESLADSAPVSAVQTPVEQVVVSIAGLYGDWRMVLPEWPGFDKPVTGDFCDFKKRDDGVAIVCADDFLQDVPDVTLDGDKLKMRWGGAFTHTIYDAVRENDGSFDGEIVQASMGLVSHRIKAKMERVPEQPTSDAPQLSLAALNNHFDDPKRAAPHAFSEKYFGRILEQKGDHEPTFPDVFKVRVAGSAEQWCLVRADAGGPADVRCRDIP